MKSSSLSLSNGFRGTISVSGDLADFANIWPSTDRLGTSRCFVFQCADFLNVWCDTIGQARHTATKFVAIRDDRGSPALLLSLGVERRFGVRILSFLDGGVADYNCPVLFPAGERLDAAVMKEVWEGLARISADFDVVVLEKMPEMVQDLKNPLVTQASQQFSNSGYFTTLQSNWVEFARRLPYAQDSRRNLRRLSELGKVEFPIAATAEERARFLAAMVEQKSRRYVQTRGIDSFDRPGYRDFFREATSRLAERGILHLSALTLDGKILAAHWGYVVGSRFYYLMPSYEFEWNRYSPGRLLLHRLLEWSVENGLAIFDQGIGDEEYKARYCDGTIPLYQDEFALTYRGKAGLLTRNAKRALQASPLGPRLQRVRLLFRRAVSKFGAGRARH
jgi:CelD/BcsL family acetyltransferase involved in cellulose biosynthesis